jgi:hypothetical protein
MSQIRIPSNNRQIVKLPCISNNWIELEVQSNQNFSLFIIKESDFQNDQDIDVETQNYLEYEGNQFERVLADGIQFYLILINENETAIDLAVSIRTIPVKYTNNVGPLSAFH